MAKKKEPKCKCGNVCAYYGEIGGYSKSCEACNARKATRQRAARQNNKPPKVKRLVPSWLDPYCCPKRPRSLLGASISVNDNRLQYYKDESAVERAFESVTRTFPPKKRWLNELLIWLGLRKKKAPPVIWSEMSQARLEDWLGRSDNYGGGIWVSKTRPEFRPASEAHEHPGPIMKEIG